jgi:hypothetical protein
VVALRLFLALGIVAVATTYSAQAVSLAEYRIKAVFLFNFVQFVEWPSNAFADARAPLVICIVGENPFGDALDQTIEGEMIDQRKLIVRHTGESENLHTCHLLFVSRSEKAHLGDVLRAVGHSAPVLTVSDIEGFVAGGGMIGFFLERNRVRFEIDPSRAQRHGLKLSSQLLGLGRIRESDPRGGAP